MELLIFFGVKPMKRNPRLGKIEKLISVKCKLRTSIPQPIGLYRLTSYIFFDLVALCMRHLIEFDREWD